MNRQDILSLIDELRTRGVVRFAHDGLEVELIPLPPEPASVPEPADKTDEKEPSWRGYTEKDLFG